MDIENDLMAIWNDVRFSQFTGRAYLFPQIEANKDLLFIGINPSYKEEHSDHQSYTIDERVNNLSYFNTFNKFAADIKLKDGSSITWTHIDLLFFRETNQKEIYNILSKTNGPEFIFEQLKVADKLIKYANPKVIIVCNALARLFLGKEKLVEKKTNNDVNVWMNYKFEFNEDLGTYLWNTTPIFFTSMLSGQRALDIGSLERLRWHVKRTLQK